MRFVLTLFLLAGGGLSSAMALSPLLTRAAEKWQTEANHWAFTVKVREIQDGEVREERVDRYDPSKPGEARWELLTVDGQAPTPERRLAWQKSKTRKHRKVPKMLSDYFDFEHASATSATEGAVSYLVPLRSNRAWLFPVEKVALTVTVNKGNYAIEEVKAGIDEPFRVALGLARIIDVDFDMKMNQRGVPVGPATSKPDGLAHVVIGRLGKRIEYTWSDFKRVTPSPDTPTADSKAEE
jgi:hypothetical protein